MERILEVFGDAIVALPFVIMMVAVFTGILLKLTV